MESVQISADASKKQRYDELFPQMKGLLSGETDLIANTANFAAVLKSSFDFFWVGFYFVKNDELVLGPFQGPLACTRIQKGKGVCGTSFAKAETIVVEDVHAFPGHIACSPLSKSEIVVPVLKNGKVVAVLDIDSDKVNMFDQTDKEELERLVTCLEESF